VTALAMVLALALEAALGWPDAVYRRIGHPVTWIGALIARLERALNHGGPMARRLSGLVLVALVCALCGGVGWALQAVLPGGWPGVALTALLAAPFMAGRSLYVHVAAVAAPLQAGDVDGARGAVAMIVGRDPAALDAPGIARAALESLGENASDGVVAPLFWGVLGGLPGLILYKGINTMDSMIGYRDARYEDFGKPAARLDDLANWLPARLTALGFALVSGRPRHVLGLAWAEAGQHRSPNAGWPEAALAGALGCRLSGPRVYGDRREAHPWVNGGCPDPDAATLRAGLGVFVRMTVLVAAALLLAGALA